MGYAVLTVPQGIFEWADRVFLGYAVAHESTALPIQNQGYSECTTELVLILHPNVIPKHVLELH